MDRKAVARQTLDIMEKGWYETEGTVVEISGRQQESVKNSILFTPEQGEKLLKQYEKVSKRAAGFKSYTWNCSTVDAINIFAGCGVFPRRKVSPAEGTRGGVRAHTSGCQYGPGNPERGR